MWFKIKNTPSNPCFQQGKPCDERTSTCHTKCESYLKWQEARNKELEEIHNKKMKSFDANDFMRDHKKRTGRSYGIFKYQGGKTK